MSKFTDFIASLTGRPTNFDHATATLTEAKATLDSVSALFTAAGLNLETMLAAGPDALKAHIESLDDSDALVEAIQVNDQLTAELETAKASALALTSQLSALNSVVATIGAAPTATQEEIKAAFEAHISKATTLALAKTGHPPAHVPAATESAPAAKTGAELHAQWKAMKAGPERLAFFTAHEAQITAFERNAPAA